MSFKARGSLIALWTAVLTNASLLWWLARLASITHAGLERDAVLDDRMVRVYLSFALVLGALLQALVVTPCASLLALARGEGALPRSQRRIVIASMLSVVNLALGLLLFWRVFLH